MLFFNVVLLMVVLAQSVASDADCEQGNGEQQACPETSSRRPNFILFYVDEYVNFQKSRNLQ